MTQVKSQVKTQVATQVKTQVKTKEEVFDKILNYCSSPYSKAEIVERYKKV